MMIQDILTSGRTLSGVSATSKKKVLELVAERVSDSVPTVNVAELFDALIARERLGTTGLGKGIAIPHCRLSSCTEPTGLFFRMDQPVDFDSVDRLPVDLIFALIVPDGDHQQHLELLKELAARLGDEAFVRALREAHSAAEMFELFRDYEIR